jgi:chaperonin cofactor prefoldin
LIDIMRAGIEALSDGSVVLPAPTFVRQQRDEVRQEWSDTVLDKRITEIVESKTSAVERKTEQLQTELAELRAQLLGELAA